MFACIHEVFTPCKQYLVTIIIIIIRKYIFMWYLSRRISRVHKNLYFYQKKDKMSCEANNDLKIHKSNVRTHMDTQTHQHLY